MEWTRTQLLAAIVLVGVLPVLGYLFGTDTAVVLLATVNVVIISGSLYYMFSPVEVPTAREAL